MRYTSEWREFLFGSTRTSVHHRHSIAVIFKWFWSLELDMFRAEWRINRFLQCQLCSSYLPKWRNQLSDLQYRQWRGLLKWCHQSAYL